MTAASTCKPLIPPTPLRRTFLSAAFAELWMAAIMLAWGAQIMIVQRMPGLDPITICFRELGVFQVNTIGLFLLCLAGTQLFSLLSWNRHGRMVAMMGEVCFSLFCFVALVRGNAFVPGTFVTPVYALFMTIRFIQVAGRWE